MNVKDTPKDSCEQEYFDLVTKMDTEVRWEIEPQDTVDTDLLSKHGWSGYVDKKETTKVEKIEETENGVPSNGKVSK